MVIKHGPQADGTFYLKGVQQKCYQLIEFEGNYYFVNDGNKIAKSKSFYIGEKYLAGTNFIPGTFTFDADGKMVIKHGPQADGTFYLNGVQQKCYQLIEFEGNYYFVNDGNKIAKSKSFYIGEKYLTGTNFVPGTFTFDADGKMVIKHGPQADGTFYLNGVQQKRYQLVEFEGDYYFVNDGDKIAKSKSFYIGEKYLVGTNLKPGVYTFDANGKMVLN